MIDPRANPAGIATHVSRTLYVAGLGVCVKWPALTV